MVEWEADDAIAAAAELYAADPRVERILICTPDKDMAQCVVGERIVLWDRRREHRSTTTPASSRSGACRPSASPDRLALVGDAADGYPGPARAGATSPASAVLARYGSLEAIPAQALGVGGARAARAPPALAATLRDRMDEALLYRDLARLRTTADGVPIPQPDVDELRWHGADRARWHAFCDEWGLDRLRRPPAPLAGRGADAAR